MKLLSLSDVTTLPGYQEVPENLPQWKKALIERKNKELYEKAMVSIKSV